MEAIIKYVNIKNNKTGNSESRAAEQIDINTYKLLETPVCNCKLNYGTIIKVVENESGELCMSKIAKASNYLTKQFILDRSLHNNEFQDKIGQPIINTGGYWEIVFGGIAFIHIPKDINFDIIELFKKIIMTQQKLLKIQPHHNRNKMVLEC